MYCHRLIFCLIMPIYANHMPICRPRTCQANARGKLYRYMLHAPYESSAPAPEAEQPMFVAQASNTHS
jgi:hypothetical protein